MDEILDGLDNDCDHRVLVEGTFLMGSDVEDENAMSDEQPKHLVTLPAFLMDVFEVSLGEYAKCVDEGGCAATGTFLQSRLDDLLVDGSLAAEPVRGVTFSEAVYYCGQSDALTPGRLPSESEWEGAASGTCELLSPTAECGDADALAGLDNLERTYPWLDTVGEPTCALAVYDADPPCFSDGESSVPGPVGKRIPGQSPFGILDMAGNVFEWTLDAYCPNYIDAPNDGSPSVESPARECDESNRIVRGGSYASNTSKLRVSSRDDVGSKYGKRDDLGFRCVYPVN